MLVYFGFKPKFTFAHRFAHRFNFDRRGALCRNGLLRDDIRPRADNEPPPVGAGFTGSLGPGSYRCRNESERNTIATCSRRGKTRSFSLNPAWFACAKLSDQRFSSFRFLRLKYGQIAQSPVKTGFEWPHQDWHRLCKLVALVRFLASFLSFGQSPKRIVPAKY